ncbi:MAG: hypothetical protein O2780_03900 [Proteobacteria bacterium]|nr:hypothetical protein [Pseudomonadota bacterium]MDA1302571.1 hypothetical protein [Pseudomonadota bacterium]
MSDFIEQAAATFGQQLGLRTGPTGGVIGLIAPMDAVQHDGSVEISEHLEGEVV